MDCQWKVRVLGRFYSNLENFSAYSGKELAANVMKTLQGTSNGEVEMSSVAK